MKKLSLFGFEHEKKKGSWVLTGVALATTQWRLFGENDFFHGRGIHFPKSWKTIFVNRIIS